jgi:hypothetical protein
MNGSLVEGGDRLRQRCTAFGQRGKRRCTKDVTFKYRIASNYNMIWKHLSTHKQMFILNGTYPIEYYYNKTRGGLYKSIKIFIALPRCDVMAQRSSIV